MAAAPWCGRHTPLQLHPTFSVPRLSLFLADRRYSCAPPTAVSLARTATCSACRRLRGSLGLDRSRDRQQDAPSRARALLRAWVRMDGEVGGASRDIGKKRALSSLQSRRDARVAHGDSRERGVAGSLPNATRAEGDGIRSVPVVKALPKGGG